MPLHQHAQDARATLASTPCPKRARRKLDAIRFVIKAAFDVPKFAMEKNPGTLKVTRFLAPIFGDKKQLAF